MDTDEATSVKACSVLCLKPLLIQKKWGEGSGGPAQSYLGSWDTYELRLRELALSTPTEGQPKRHQGRAHNYIKNCDRGDRAKHFSAVLVRQKWPQIQVWKALVRHQEKFPHLEVVLH